MQVGFLLAYLKLFNYKKLNTREFKALFFFTFMILMSLQINDHQLLLQKMASFLKLHKYNITIWINDKINNNTTTTLLLI